jgi:hypothetical protein
LVLDHRIILNTKTLSQFVMLGDIIYEAVGKLMGTRVLEVQNGIPKVEVTISQEGLIRGINVTSIVTFWSIFRDSGAIYAEGHGIIMKKDNPNDTATWTGQGIAHFSEQTRRDVGSVFFMTQSAKGNLGFLNNMVGAFEYESKPDGTSKGKIWEWK